MDSPQYKRPFSTLRKNEHYYSAQQLGGLARLSLLLFPGFFFRSAACEKLLIIPAKTLEGAVSVRLALPGGRKKCRMAWDGRVHGLYVGSHRVSCFYFTICGWCLE